MEMTFPEDLFVQSTPNQIPRDSANIVGVYIDEISGFSNTNKVGKFDKLTNIITCIGVRI